MGIRENLQKLVDRKQGEINDLEQRLRDAKVYLQAVQDSMKALPKDLLQASSDSAPRELRSGTTLASARDLLRRAGNPLYIGDILAGLGMEPNKSNRLSLTGSLGSYVREGRIFTRPAPNTFGLVEFQNSSMEDVNEPPEDFGKMEKVS